MTRPRINNREQLLTLWSSGGFVLQSSNVAISRVWIWQTPLGELYLHSHAEPFDRSGAIHGRNLPLLLTAGVFILRNTLRRVFLFWKFIPLPNLAPPRMSSKRRRRSALPGPWSSEPCCGLEIELRLPSQIASISVLTIHSIFRGPLCQ